MAVGHTTLRAFLDAVMSPAVMRLSCGGPVCDLTTLGCINNSGGLRQLTELHMAVCPLQNVVIASESLRVISLGRCPHLRNVRLICPALHDLTIGCEPPADGSAVPESAAAAAVLPTSFKQCIGSGPQSHCVAPEINGMPHLEVSAKSLRRLTLCAALFERQPFEVDHNYMKSDGCGRGELTISNWMAALSAPRLRELTLQKAAAHVDMVVLQWLLDCCPLLEKLDLSFGGAPDELDTSRTLRCPQPCRLRHVSLTQLSSGEPRPRVDGVKGLVSDAGADEIETMLPSARFMPAVPPRRPFLPTPQAPPAALLILTISFAAAEDGAEDSASKRFELKPKPYSFHPLWRSWSRHFWPGVRQIGVGHWRKA